MPHPEISDRNIIKVTPANGMLRPSLIHICTTSYPYTGHTVPLCMQSHPRIVHGLGSVLNFMGLAQANVTTPARNVVNMSDKHASTPSPLLGVNTEVVLVADACLFSCQPTSNKHDLVSHISRARFPPYPFQKVITESSNSRHVQH